MEPEKILHELTYAEGLPREALKAASAQRGEMVSLFLHEIESYLALEPAARANPTPLFFIFHLLGEWQEKAAYRPLARLLRLPRRDVDTIFGDGITTTSHRVVASVFDGDPEPPLRHHPGPEGRGIHSGGHVRSARDGHLARRTRSGSGRPLPPRCLHGDATTSGVLRLGRLAERDCNAGHERFEAPGKESVRPRLHRQPRSRIRPFRGRSQTRDRASWRTTASGRSRQHAIRRYGRRIVRMVLV